MSAELSRREVLAAAGVGLLATGAAPAPTSLDALARAKGLRFGSAVGTGLRGRRTASFQDPRYRALLTADCGVIVPENELKLYAVKRQAAAYDFAPADQLAAFAKAQGIAFRGHTLLWNRDEFAPDWAKTEGIGSGKAAEAWLTGYVRTVAGRYAGQIQSWDVVNESIDPKTGAMRDSLFTRAIGPEVVEVAFHAAHEAAPKARLVYNDYMGWGSGDAKHRAGVLRLLERLKARGAPIHALGVQGHIGNGDAGNVIDFPRPDRRDWRAFIDEARGMGLDLLITEFDVNDTVMPADPAKRDAIAASVAGDFLDLMLDYRETKQVLAWGLCDKYSWLQTWWPRADKLAKRPTLYDADFQPKPLRDAVAAALRAAPERKPWA